MRPARERNNRGIYRCGVCRELGHTRDTCPRARPHSRVPGWGGTNADYARNRELGACDNCGRRSKKPFCWACQCVRNEQCSRDPEYRREYDRRLRERLGLTSNASRKRPVKMWSRKGSRK